MPVWSPALFFSSTSEEAYVIQDSVMFDGSADYLTLTPSFDASNNNKVTFSWWQKRSNFGAVSWLYDAGSNNDQMQFAAADDLEVSLNATTDAYLNTTALFRDPTAWQHFVVSFDTGNSTSGDRMRIWNNGTEITAFDTDTMPSAGYALDFLANGIVQNLGRRGNNSQFWGGYLAEFIGLDGISVTDASKFGETNDDGIWIPKDPSDTDNIADWGGSNSFWLKFADATNLGFNSRPTALTANAGTYKIDNSLWLDGSAQYLNKTFSGSGTSRKKITLSSWFKLGSTSTTQTLISCDDTGSDKEFMIWVQSDATIRIANYEGGTNHLNLITTPLYRDPTAWQHLVFQADTDTVSNTNSIKLWINGVKVTAFSTETYPAIDFEFALGNSFDHEIGRYALSNNNLWNGYIAEMIFLDGSSKPASDFGGWDASGNWLPVDPTSVVSSGKGTNGFWLDFADSSAPGNDVSGNNNDFSANGTIATTQTNTDSPTNTSGDNEGNYATLNPLSKSSGGATTATISEGNTRWLRPNDGSNNQQCYATFGADEGKFYFEFKLLQANNGFDTGLFAEGEINGNEGGGFSGYDVQGYYLENYGTGVVWKVTTADGSGSGSRTDTGDSCTANDVMKIAVDFDAGKIWLGNVTQDTYYNSSGADVAFNTSTPTFTFTANTRLFPYIFGHAQVNEAKFRFLPAEWTGSAPTGFEPWNTSELAAPTVTDPRKYWSNTLYVGSAAIRSVRQCFDSTGTAWAPDFVWIKNRTGVVASHHLYDVVRGANKFIKPNNTDAQDSSRTDMLTSFDSGGFSLGVDASEEAINKNNDTYVSWCMKAGGAASSNSNGNISSSVSVADHGGFSIVKYDPGGSGSPGDTVGHGLSRAPNFIILKVLEAVGDQNWSVGSDDIAWTNNIFLNLDLAASAGSGPWNNTAPTSSVFSIGSDRDNDAAYIAYCFAKTPGLIACGTYTGNGSDDGPVVIVDDGASGFRPTWVMCKRTDSTGNWAINDAARSPYNETNSPLFADQTAIDGSGINMDFIANGFKIRNSSTTFNASSGTYIYLAFADEPFNLARAR